LLPLDLPTVDYIQSTRSRESTLYSDVRMVKEYARAAPSINLPLPRQ
jgi:hypothetical protein